MARTKIHRQNNVLDSVVMAVDSIFSGFFSSAGREAYMLMDKIEAKTLSLETKMIRAFGSALLMGIGVLFLILSIYFYMIEYQGMTRASSFFVLAISLFILSWIAKRFWGQNYGTKNY
ncbi:hypothetical protein HY487_00935 [Candidatus Woesearchaeota archaeon]|nr:hypothetical protein [Candidatus Woesearchaeota archaeon]